MHAHVHGNITPRPLCPTEIPPEAQICVLSTPATSFSRFPDTDAPIPFIPRGERFAEVSETSREQIARLGHSFVRDGTVVLTHGYSRCALHLLLMAAETKVRWCKLQVCKCKATENMRGSW